MASLPVVSIFGLKNIKLESIGPIPDFETQEMDCRCYLTDDNLYEILSKDRPGVIVSFGDFNDFPNIIDAPWDIRRRWIHFENTDELDKKGAGVFTCFIDSALRERPDFPLITVFTPAFKTGEKIRRPFASLLAQTYKNWEWVIMDDSDDEGQTFEMLSELADQDYRVRVFKEHRHSGTIGRVKRNACMLGRGEFLVELDHDDELTPFALGKVVEAYQSDPEIGFVYTDFSECNEDGLPLMYGDGWGFGYGSYREESHGGQKYAVSNGPNVNPKTIRHIVAAPNHIRSWRKSLYQEIGGHNDIIHVADDYEIMVRTFLATRMARVPHMCYVQYRNYDTGNTHQARILEIQRLVRYFSQWYDARIHERFLELGVDDFVWKDGESSFHRLNEVPNQPEESHCTILVEG